MKSNLRPFGSISDNAQVKKAFRRRLVAAAIVSAGLSTHAIASAALYPTCDTPFQTQCAMQDVGNQQVMSGGVTGVGDGNEVAIYIIFYGPFSGVANGYLTTDIFNMLRSISDSSYEAIAETYAGTSGRFVANQVQDSSASQGTTLTSQGIINEIALQISNGSFPADPNGVYMVLPDNTIQITANGGYCSAYCGYNTSSTIAGQDLHYLIVGDALGCSLCSWSSAGVSLTPNNANGADLNGSIDGELSLIGHELNETITDPNGSSGGWYSASTGNANTQMADFCEWGTATDNVNALGSTYSVSTPAGTATANFHGTFGDFLLQTLRVNYSSGTQGYCANSYGGAFWGTILVMYGHPITRIGRAATTRENALLGSP